MNNTMKIVKNGIYDTDIDIYHSQLCCSGPSVSSSGLRTILRECPAKFFATSDLNPKRFPPVEKESFDFGRAAHALVLGEPQFFAKFIISPYDDFRKKEAQEWRDSQKLQIVKMRDMALIEDIAKAQRESLQGANAFIEGEPEKTVVVKDEVYGIWLKSRPDWLPFKPQYRWICEYKTCNTIEPRKLANEAFGYGYEMQAAMTLDLVEKVTGNKPLGIAHICQEKSPPFLCETRLYTAEQLDWGRNQYHHALSIFAHCLEKNDWPSYTTEPTYFETPYWVAKQMEAFHDRAELPAGEYGPGDYLAAG